MAVTTTRVNNGKGTVTYTIAMTTDLDNGDAMAEQAARYIYQANGDPIPIHYQLYDFDSLTNQQRLAIIGRAAKGFLVDCAKAGYINTATDTARDTATEEAEDLDIED